MKQLLAVAVLAGFLVCLTSGCGDSTPAKKETSPATPLPEPDKKDANRPKSA